MPSSVSSGRRFVRETLALWSLPQLVDDAELAASELITNAVIHAGAGPNLRLSQSVASLRIEVRDDSSAAPTQRSFATDAATGRGLSLVDSVSSAWGFDAHDNDGKTVWCEFALQPTSAATAAKTSSL